jgi:endo-1,4-beta-xylanase
MGIALSTAFSHAQPAKGANKFLGNITTNGSVRSDFSLYWNQITGENESKWMTIEGTRDSMNWTGADRIAAYARAQGIPWKFHSLITGGTYPNWIASLTDAELLEEIAEWMDSAAQRYPDVTMIDVVNEAYPAHF